MYQPGYMVVPDALSGMKHALLEAAETWETLKTTVDDLTMASLDLGLLGESVDYPDSYNGVKDDIVDKLSTGHDVLASTGEALTDAVTTYQNQDAEYYEDFGYIESELD